MKTQTSFSLIGSTLALAVSVLLSPVAAQAADNTWIRASNGEWTDDANWSAGSIPDDTTHAIFDAADPGDGTLTWIAFNGGTVDVGAISLAAGSEVQRYVRGQNDAVVGTGTLALHGVNYSLPGYANINLLMANFTGTGDGKTLQFYNGTDSLMTLALENSGYIHAVGQVTIANPIVDGSGGAAGITKTGEGLLRLSNSNAGATADSTYSGGFTMEAGEVEWTQSGNSTASPFGTGILTLRGGTLHSSTSGGRSINNDVALDGQIAFGWSGSANNGNITVNSTGGTRSTTLLSDSTIFTHADQTLTWYQAVGGNFRLTKDGAGSLLLTGLGGSNSFEALSVLGGVVEIQGAASLPGLPGSYEANHFILDDGTLRFTDANLTLNSNRGVALGVGGGTVETDGVDIGTNSAIIDLNGGTPGSLTKTGSGNFTITSLGSGSYTGATVVEGGGMFVNGSLIASTVEVQSGATFGGSGSVSQAITVRDGAVLAPGEFDARGTLTTGSTLVLESNADLAFSLDSALSFDAIQANGAVTLGGAELVLSLNYLPSVSEEFVLINNLSGLALTGLLNYGGVTLTEGASFLYDDGTYVREFTITYDQGGFDSLAITAVPEPGTLALLLIAAAGLVCARRHRPHLCGAS